MNLTAYFTAIEIWFLDLENAMYSEIIFQTNDNSMNEEKVDKYFEKNINELKKIASMCFTGDELEELLTIKTLEDCSFLDCTCGYFITHLLL